MHIQVIGSTISYCWLRVLERLSAPYRPSFAGRGETLRPSGRTTKVDDTLSLQVVNQSSQNSQVTNWRTFFATAAEHFVMWLRNTVILQPLNSAP